MNTNYTKAESELTLIKKIMEDSRNSVAYNGIHFVFWGALVAVCLLLNYAFLVTGTLADKIGILWAVMMTAGAIADVIISVRMDKSRHVVTFAGKLLSYLWISSGIAMFMFGFLGPLSGAYKPVYICPIISTMLGVSYFVSGCIQQLPWLRNLSYAWWAGAFFMFLLPGRHTLLVFALMMIALQVIPGLIINRDYKKSLALKQA